MIGSLAMAQRYSFGLGSAAYEIGTEADIMVWILEMGDAVLGKLDSGNLR